MKIVVCIEGGLIQDVYCTDPKIDLVVLNWDTADAPDDEGLIKIGNNYVSKSHPEVFQLIGSEVENCTTKD